MAYRGRAMSLLTDEREFGTRFGGKPKTAQLDLRLPRYMAAKFERDVTPITSVLWVASTR